MSRVVVVEDDARTRATLVAELQDEGLEVVAFPSVEPALPEFGPGRRTDLLLVDVRLPGRSGVELVRELAGRGALPPTIVTSGEATISETVEALRLGVYDFLEKPFGRERLRTSIRNALARAELEGEVAALRSAMGESELLGRSPAMLKLRETISSAAPTDATVLIRGESGTGKELVAASIHSCSRRPQGPFIKVNCAAIAPGLIEDELFGHVRGAFTDARASKAGLFEAAHGGTLLLDEIGDMDGGLQARLLRVIEDGKLRRLGESRETPVNVRVLASTHQDLELAVGEGRFRQDLYFRLAQIVIDVPPLRERAGDVALLAAHFVELACRKQRTPLKSLEPEALGLLERHAWPGNVRELRHACERAVVLGGDPIRGEDLGLRTLGSAVPVPGSMLRLELAEGLSLKDVKATCEREFIQHVLEEERWNLAAAARRLGLQRTYLHAKLSALGIVRPR